MSKKGCMVFTGGGTGGHVFPGLAVAAELKKAGWDNLMWIGSKTGMEKAILEKEQIPFYSIPAGKLRRYFSLKNLFDVFKILMGLAASIVLLIKLKPCLLFSKGGYVTVPPVIAAALLGIPVITHESDFDPGMATRINARFAHKILTSFKQTASFFSEEIAAKVIHTGNPVRTLFLNADAARGRAFVGCPQDKKLILILGGSQGAEKINNAIGLILDHLTDNFFVVHQMGKRGYRERQKANYFASAFFHDELADILAASTLVICRAGSNTLWELAATATPALLVPLSLGASRGDQLQNAELFRQCGAAAVIREPDLKDKLLEIILNLLNNREQLAAMKKNMQALSNPRAACDIAHILLQIKGVNYAD